MEMPEQDYVDKAVPRADELTAEQLQEFGQRYQLVCLIESGKTARQALSHMMTLNPNFSQSLRWAQNIYSRYKQHGVKGLIDGRWHSEHPKGVLTQELKQLVLAWWYARPNATVTSIWREVVDACNKRELPSPGYDVVKRFLAFMPEHDKLVRAGKIRVWDKQSRPVVRYNITSYSNERWQIDHTRADIYIRARVGDRWEIREVWFTAALDAHSRCIVGIQLSTKTPDAWTSALLLRHAVLPKENPAWLNKGLPNILQPDRGKDFMSHAVAASLAYLGIILDPDPPFYPNRKGKIERFFRTLDEGCLRILPGHMKTGAFSNPTSAQKNAGLLLTRAQLLKEIEHFIVHEYHHREHSETKRKPIELWQETVRLRMPESEDALDNCLLKSDKIRKVRNTGIDFLMPGKSSAETRGGRYWSPELTHYWSREIRLRYNPEDLQSVLVYCAATGEYLCEAWLMGQEDSKYGIADIKRTRNQFRKGLVERQKDYMKEIHREDRRMANKAEWDEARARADEEAAIMAETPIANDEDMSSVEAMLAEFERRDRAGK